MRASTFHPPTLEMLDELGITSRLIERGLKAPVYHWRDRQTGEIFAFDMAEIADATRYPFRIQCEQYYLSRMLAELVEEEPCAEVLFNHRLVHFSQDETGVVVHVETPTDIKTIRADYLIGTDGASSIIRKWLGTEFDGFTYPEKFLCLTTDTPLEETLPGLAAVNYLSDPQEWLVLLRVPTLWRVLLPGYEESNEHLVSDAKKNDVFQRLIGHGEDVTTFHRTIYRVHQRVAKQFQVGRVFLAGDAAHLNNPIGGFGMNSGIHDAFNLAHRMIGVTKGGENASHLEGYDRQRRAITYAFTQRQTIENMALMKAGLDQAHNATRAKMIALLENPEERRGYLLRQAMITSLAEAEAIA
jgi:3-(3-hydroxy-phenyl)propionate hydroxylase